MEHTYTFWTIVSVLIAVGMVAAWWMVRRARIEDEKHRLDLKELADWQAARDALARRKQLDQHSVVDLRDKVGERSPSDAGSTAVGHALGVALVLGMLLLLLGLAGGVEGAGL